MTIEDRYGKQKIIISGLSAAGCAQISEYITYVGLREEDVSKEKHLEEQS